VWSMNCLPFLSTWVHPWFLVGFLLLILSFLCTVLYCTVLYCIVLYCRSLSFFFCLLCCLSFDLRLLNIPLVSSNFLKVIRNRKSPSSARSVPTLALFISGLYNRPKSVDPIKVSPKADLPPHLL